MTAVSMGEYDRLVSLAYEAAIDHARWRVLIEELARIAGGDVGIAAHDFGGFGFLGAINTHEPEFDASYGEYYSSINPWVPAFTAMPVGIAQPIEAYVPRASLLKTEFYGDWLRPQQILTAAGIVLHRDERRFLGLAVNFAAQREDSLLQPMLGLLDMLAPHVRRSFNLTRQLSGVSIDVLRDDLLEAIPTATFLVDRRGRLIRTNALGEDLLRLGRTIRQERDGRLVFLERQAQEHLDLALEGVTLGRHSHVSATFTARSEENALPMQASIAPFRSASGFDLPPFNVLTDNLPAAVIAVSPLSPSGARVQLAARYQLSPAEQRVAEALCAGNTLKGYAEERGISIHTARNQLKSLMAKTGVTRQSQLVALFASPLLEAQ